MSEISEKEVEAGARAIAKAWGETWECCCTEQRGLDCDCGDAMTDEREAYDERLSREDCRMAARAALEAAAHAKAEAVGEEYIDELAYRFWSVHPKELDEWIKTAPPMPLQYKGGVRAWFFACEMRSALAHPESSAEAVESLWATAKPEHLKIGWTYDFDQTERLSRAAEAATGYDATMEVVEFVMAEADRRHKSALAHARAEAVGVLSEIEIANAMEDAAKAAFVQAQSVYRADHDHFPLKHTWETTLEGVREGWRKIAHAAVEAAITPPVGTQPEPRMPRILSALAHPAVPEGWQDE